MFPSYVKLFHQFSKTCLMAFSIMIIVTIQKMIFDIYFGINKKIKKLRPAQPEFTSTTRNPALVEDPLLNQSPYSYCQNYSSLLGGKTLSDQSPQVKSRQTTLVRRPEKKAKKGIKHPSNKDKLRNRHPNL